MTNESLIQVTESGLYCPLGDFHIDPWRPVERAVITHCHSDHAKWGCQDYLTAEEGKELLRARVGPEARIQGFEYHQPLDLNGVRISLHPAGHILGSSQIRVEYRGEVWVISGDYKDSTDPTCAAFEPVQCHTFVTESTFGLPIFRWPPQNQVFEEINQWWRANRANGRASVLFCYAVGKAQRVLAGVDASIGPIYGHGAVLKMNEQYSNGGIELPEVWNPIGENGSARKIQPGALVVAPPSANGTPWLRRFGDLSTGFVSGWMRIRGLRRRRAVDRGFILSDHVDWPGLQSAIQATGAERVLATHGYVNPLVRYLRETGLDARPLSTPFQGELIDGE